MPGDGSTLDLLGLLLCCDCLRRPNRLSAVCERRRVRRRGNHAERVVGRVHHACTTFERPGGRSGDPARPWSRPRCYVRVSLLGIELVTVDLRVVIASVDTYLRFAQAVNRLDLHATDESWSIGRLGEEEEEMGKSVGKGAVEGGMEGIKEKV